MTSAFALLLGVAGFFSVEKDGAGRWSVRDPEGRPFVIRGIDHVAYRGHSCEFDGRRHYEEANRRMFPTREAWVDDTVGKLKAWGFNMLATGCDSELRHHGIPYAFFAWMGQGFCAKGGKGASMTGESGGCGKAFPNVFATNFVSWCEQWAQRNCAPLKDDRDLVGYFIDNELKWWALEGFPPERRREIAERYFAVTTAAIRKADPNHMILGCRFAGLKGVSEDVWRIAGRCCDIVSFNFYPWADLDRGVVFENRHPGARRAVDVFAICSRLAGGAPLLVTEWSFPSLDSGLPCTGGAGMRVRTQAERAAATELFARTMLAAPEVVGYDYFMWVDEPRLGISRSFREDSNYGLVAESGEVYRDLTDMFACLHAEIASGRPITLPRERSVDPYLKPFAAAVEAWGWKKRKGSPTPAFAREGNSWRVENAAGLRLEGSVGGGLVGSVLTSRGRLGSLHGMLQGTSGGKTAYRDLSGVLSVTNASAAGMLRLVMPAEGRIGETRFRLTYEILVPNDDCSFAVNLRQLENLGPDPLDVTRVYVRQMTDFHLEKTPSPPLIRNFWHSPLADGWDAKDGRYFGVTTRAPMVDAVFYWNGSDGSPHSDAMFVPSGELKLGPGETWEPKGGVWYRVVCEKEGTE